MLFSLSFSAPYGEATDESASITKGKLNKYFFHRIGCEIPQNLG